MCNSDKINAINQIQMKVKNNKATTNGAEKSKKLIEQRLAYFERKIDPAANRKKTFGQPCPFSKFL